jgi:drug/metabolite transporter (DMT)-like permease
MIQRIQTLWLLLASICAFASVNLPFYFGSLEVPGPTVTITPYDHFMLLVFVIATGLVALINIFLYSNRSLQIKISVVGVLLGLVNLMHYFLYMRNFKTGGLSLYSIFSFLVPVFFILSIIGMYKDQKLLKSLDRLR